MVTHKTNIADTFGKNAGDVQEGEAFVYKGQRLRPRHLCGAHKAGRLERESVK